MKKLILLIPIILIGCNTDTNRNYILTCYSASELDGVYDFCHYSIHGLRCYKGDDIVICSTGKVAGYTRSSNEN